MLPLVEHVRTENEVIDVSPHEAAVCVTGGVALNPAFRHHLSDQLGVELWVPDEPQLTGALGAAVLALEGENK